MTADPTAVAGLPDLGAAPAVCQRDGVFVLGRPSDEKLVQALYRVRGTPLTYAEVGETLAAGTHGELPPGYHHVRARRSLGQGDDVFAAAREGIERWQLHRRQGFRVAPAEPPIAPETEVICAVPLAGPVHVLVACRIVGVVDEPDRFGFAYGTLRLHPETGEEAFVVERDASGVVRAEITAFSRPRHPLVRLGAPVARRQQARATQGYLDALQSHIAEALASPGPPS
jgi:uncharacterized protein (UPF0548 family)